MWKKEIVLQGPQGPQGPAGPAGSGDVPLVWNEIVSPVNLYFNATVNGTNGFYVPSIVYDLTNYSVGLVGGSFTIEYTPVFDSGSTVPSSVNGYLGYKADNSLAIASTANLNSISLTSGTRVTQTATLGSAGTNGFLSFVPKFMSAGTNFAFWMNDVVIKIGGVEIPKRYLINFGSISAFTVSTTQTKISKIYDYVVPTIMTRWQTKRVCFYGDSISASIVGTAPAGSPTYPTLVSQMLGFGYVDNRTASGMAVRNAANELLSRMDQHHFFDLIMIALGVNDYILQTYPIGTIGAMNATKNSYNKDTFFGAFRWCLDTMIEDNPDVEVVLIQPIPKQNDGANTLGLTLEDFRQAIRDIGKMYNFPVFETTLSINEKNRVLPMIDSLHVGYTGHRRYADRLGSFLASV